MRSSIPSPTRQRGPEAAPSARAGYGPHCAVRRCSGRWPEGPYFIAIWRGHRAPPTFQSEGAARAYLATCDVAGRLRR